MTTTRVVSRPGRMPSTFTTLALMPAGCLGTAIMPASYSTRRQPPQSRAMAESRACSHRRAAPMPRVAERVSESVFLVPKATSVESVVRSRVGETSASAAARMVSRRRPMRGSAAQLDAGEISTPEAPGAISVRVVVDVHAIRINPAATRSASVEGQAVRRARERVATLRRLIPLPSIASPPCSRPFSRQARTRSRTRQATERCTGSWEKCIIHDDEPTTYARQHPEHPLLLAARARGGIRRVERDGDAGRYHRDRGDDGLPRRLAGAPRQGDLALGRDARSDRRPLLRADRRRHDAVHGAVEHWRLFRDDPARPRHGGRVSHGARHPVAPRRHVQGADVGQGRHGAAARHPRRIAGSADDRILADRARRGGLGDLDRRLHARALARSRAVSLRRASGMVLAALVLLTGVPAMLRAQLPRAAVAPEVRLDVIGGRPSSVQGAVGLELPAGAYVRVGLLAGLGATVERAETSRAAGRVDVLARFLLDPFRQSRLGFSAGAGVSVRADPGERVSPKLLVALDLEGRRWANGVTPALQIGLGGGVRGGVGLRWSGRAAR